MTGAYPPSGGWTRLVPSEEDFKKAEGGFEGKNYQRYKRVRKEEPENGAAIRQAAIALNNEFMERGLYKDWGVPVSRPTWREKMKNFFGFA